jgi:hypothetical protein
VVFLCFPFHAGHLQACLVLLPQVSRTVKVIDFCAAGQYKCGDPPTCSAVPCSSAAALTAATPNASPVITLRLPPSTPFLFQDPSANRTYYLPFGEAGLLNMLPCADATGAAAGCAGTARDKEVGCAGLCRHSALACASCRKQLAGVSSTLDLAARG